MRRSRHGNVSGVVSAVTVSRQGHFRSASVAVRHQFRIGCRSTGMPIHRRMHRPSTSAGFDAHFSRQRRRSRRHHLLLLLLLLLRRRRDRIGVGSGRSAAFHLSCGFDDQFDAIGTFVIDASAAHRLAEILQHGPRRPWQIAKVTMLPLVATHSATANAAADATAAAR